MILISDHRPLLMGILNVTPELLSDGNAYPSIHAAVDAGRRMIEEGADLIDVSGQSTRPGSDVVSCAEELDRTASVVEALVAAHIPVSIGTTRAAVAREALAIGAEMVNDITALADADMRELCSVAGCYVCLMHMLGAPRTLVSNPEYNDVVSDVKDFLSVAVNRAEEAGIHPSKIIIDPGLGFGKTADHSMALLRNLRAFVDTGYAVLLGVSGKHFVNSILVSDSTVAHEGPCFEGTLALQVLAQMSGAKIIRTHQVAATRRAMRVATAVSAGFSV